MRRPTGIRLTLLPFLASAALATSTAAHASGGLLLAQADSQDRRDERRDRCEGADCVPRASGKAGSGFSTPVARGGFGSSFVPSGG
jgi:hypothetical protein